MGKAILRTPRNRLRKRPTSLQAPAMASDCGRIRNTMNILGCAGPTTSRGDRLDADGRSSNRTLDVARAACTLNALLKLGLDFYSGRRRGPALVKEVEEK